MPDAVKGLLTADVQCLLYIRLPNALLAFKCIYLVDPLLALPLDLQPLKLQLPLELQALELQPHELQELEQQPH